MATKTVPADIQAFCRLLRDIRALPDVARPGFLEGDDDSMRHNHDGAAVLVEEFIRLTPHALARPLGAFLVAFLAGSIPNPDEQWFVERFDDHPFGLAHERASNVIHLAASRVEGRRPA